MNNFGHSFNSSNPMPADELTAEQKLMRKLQESQQANAQSMSQSESASFMPPAPVVKDITPDELAQMARQTLTKMRSVSSVNTDQGSPRSTLTGLKKVGAYSQDENPDARLSHTKLKSLKSTMEQAKPACGGGLLSGLTSMFKKKQ